MKRFITATRAIILILTLSLYSCTSAFFERGTLSAEVMLSDGRIYHAARISTLFQYINPGSGTDDSTDVIEPLIPCVNAAFIRGLTCWVGDDSDSGIIWYAQMRSYIDTTTHKSARHNIIARFNTVNGATDTFLQDWQYSIEQLLLYGGDIYFLSKNADGLRDVWVMSQSGGTPTLYVQNDGVDIAILGMENGVLYLQNKEGGVFRADKNSGKVTLTQLIDCDFNVGIYIWN